jgi:hypothetical protein
VIDRNFYEKIQELTIAMDNLVDRSAPIEIRRIAGWHEFLLVAVLATRTLYGTITYLSRDKGGKDDLMPKLEYGVATSPLARSLLELLFTVIFIREQPRTRVKWFHHSGWRELREMVDSLRERYGSKRKWKTKLVQLENSVEQLRVSHKVSKRATGDPRSIKWWPTAMQMLDPKKNYLHKRSRCFLDYLTLRYRTLSQDHHLSGAGLVRVYAKLLIDEKDARREPILRDLKNSNVILALATLLAIYTEINDICRFDRGKALAYCWCILMENRDEVRELYDLRYRSMLRQAP